MLAASSKLHRSLKENEEVVLDIPLIHFTYFLIQARLVNFSSLVRVLPNVIGVILRQCDQLNLKELVSLCTECIRIIKWCKNMTCFNCKFLQKISVLIFQSKALFSVSIVYCFRNGILFTLFMRIGHKPYGKPRMQHVTSLPKIAPLTSC